MCTHAEAGYLLHLQFNETINQVITEDTACFEKFPVAVQFIQRLIQTGANLRYGFCFLWS